ncbi:MAG: helical backbone metal receptor [Saprospiraceae bacterium]|nr:helical backbone metal receptor [Saprospiraceae bacterium]
MSKRIFRDQMNRQVEIDFPPQRIISLVPSQTELLHDLGLEKQVVGITKFCVHPESWFKSKTRVGGTKDYKLEVIRELQPDLIIGNKEENDKEQIEALAEEFPVWMSNIYDLEDALEMIQQVSDITNQSASGARIRLNIQSKFESLEQEMNRPPIRAAYYIWRKPNMVAGNDTFINHMLQRAGFINVFDDLERYPEVTDAQLAGQQPEVILLSSEPFPFKEKHIAEFGKICPSAVIQLVDGELFSWYGSRLLQSVPYFRTLHKHMPNS